MRNLILTAALAFGFALPLAAIPTTADADPWYKVEQGRAPGADGKIVIRSRSHGEGRVKCVVPRGEVFHRNHEQNWSRWIHAQWTKRNPLTGFRRAQEREYRDAHGRWCPVWDRRGWIDKSDPDLRVIHIVDRHYTIRAVPDTWTQTVKSTGKWGSDVPVFRDQDAFFKARDSLAKNGNYDGQLNKVVCRLKKGQHVSFRPFKNWGVGEVVRDNCKGWVDKGEIQQNTN